MVCGRPSRRFVDRIRRSWKIGAAPAEIIDAVKLLPAL
jgi:hypothetical protein